MDYREIKPLTHFVAVAIAQTQAQQNGLFLWEQAVQMNKRGWMKLSNDCYTLSLDAPDLMDAFSLGAIIGWIN